MKNTHEDEERDEDEQDEDEVVVDANGTPLANGDTVLVIKDLKVKGSPVGFKKGTKIKNIRLTGGTEGISGSTDQIKGFTIRAEYVKKA
jgi:protein PhnA